VSCLLLGCFFAKALRQEGVITVSEYLGNSFGPRFRHYSSALSSVGMFLHIVGQFLAAIAILQSIFGFADFTAGFVTLGLILIFVTTGGIAGAGVIGKIKLFSLYLIMIVCSTAALYLGGGPAEIIAKLPENSGMFDFSKYGLGTAAGDIFSMLVGVLSTQIYLQAIFSAENVREARNGAFLSAAVIPPIGILGLIVGLYLRAHYSEVAANSAQALPFFIEHTFPPVVAALFSAGILLVVLGTGSGLVLGVTTNIYNDFLGNRPGILSKIHPVRLLRLISFVVLFLALALVFTGLDSTILRWSYMSMGLRGAAIFAGLFVVVFFKSYVDYRGVRMFLYCLPVVYILTNI